MPGQNVWTTLSINGRYAEGRQIPLHCIAIHQVKNVIIFRLKSPAVFFLFHFYIFRYHGIQSCIDFTIKLNQYLLT